MPNRSLRPFLNIWHVLLVLLAGWMIFNLVQTVQYVIADYSPVPFMDYWREPQFWPAYKAFRFATLWQQHNEHRIVFPELIYILDMFLLRGRMYLPIILSGLCYAGVWVVLAWAVYSQNIMKSPVSEAALLLAGTLMAWKGCSSVIATPFQLQFTLLQFTSVVALASLTMLADTGNVRYLASIIGAAAIGTYSSGNGMLLWIVLIVGAALLRLSKTQILTLACSAVVFAGAYFIGYQSPAGKMSGNLKHPLRALAFLFSYLSMPFGSFNSRVFGIALGALNLLLMGVCMLLAWRRGLWRSHLGVVLFGTYLFTVSSALLAALARMDTFDYNFDQAKAWRYVTMPTVAWALLAIAAIWLMDSAKSRDWAFAAALIIAGFFGYGFVKARTWVEGTRMDLGSTQIAAGMLRNNVFDPATVMAIFPSPEFVRMQLETLKRDRKSIYARGVDKWIGQDITPLGPQTTPIEGKITRVYPVPGGLEILGWSEETRFTDEHAVLFVDANNKIAGFGRRPSAAFPPNVGSWDTPNPLAFVGFVSLAKPVGVLSVYIRTSHGRRLQPIEGKIEVPDITAVGGDTASLANITWQPDAKWTLGGYPALIQNGLAPSGAIYASWSGSDANTGQIRSAPFAAPANRCLVLPVLHGASSYGQSVEVVDADANQVIETMPMLDGRSIWERWRIPLPQATRNVAIVARDEGSGPSQWLALANPEQCP